MADTRKYYYLKLKEDFFDSDELKILQHMPDGYIYSDILLKLYLKSTRSEGKLLYKDLIPYTPDILATITNHQVGTVEKALDTFKMLGLIEILDNGTIYMMDIQSFIGQSSTEADRKREYRSRIERERIEVKRQMSGQTSGQISEQMSGQMSTKVAYGQMSGQCPPEIEKEIEKDIEIDKRVVGTEQTQIPTDTPPIITLQLNTGEEYPFREKDIAEYAALYPAVDIMQQMRKMKGWLLSHPKKRKTKRGIQAFVNRWLSEEQDNGSARYQRRQTSGSRTEQFQDMARGWAEGE